MPMFLLFKWSPLILVKKIFNDFPLFVTKMAKHNKHKHGKAHKRKRNRSSSHIYQF